MANISNTELIKRLKKGDIKAFDEIYRIYCNRLFGFVLKFIKQESDAEEIVQEVFVRIWSSRDKIDEFASFDSFLFTIAYNNTMSLLRKRLNEQKYLDHLKNIQEGFTNDIIDELHYQELNQRYKQVIDQLTPRQKEVYLLSREEGLTYKEIAAKTGISKNTVEIHMTKAINFIKTNLSKTLLINTFFVDMFIS